MRICKYAVIWDVQCLEHPGFCCVKWDKAADLPLLMNENTRTILALDFLSSRHATQFHHQISVWPDTVWPCAFPLPRGIYCKQRDKYKSCN